MEARATDEQVRQTGEAGVRDAVADRADECAPEQRGEQREGGSGGGEQVPSSARDLSRGAMR